MTATKNEVKAPIPKQEKARNGLIDLYRFLLSLVVVHGHSLFVVRGPYFGPGSACVEFFFVLSGYLFWSFLNKSKERTFKENLYQLHKTRFLPLAIPICIGVLSNIIESIYVGEFGIWGYLWYIEVMFIEMIALILLRKWIKSDKKFMITIMSVMVIAIVLKYFGPFYSFGYIRGAATIPMGIFLASLPKIKKKWIVIPLLIPVMIVCFFIICFHWKNVEWFGYKIPELILDNVLYPALIYLTFCLKVKSKFLSYLGALSFGLYAFQCPADMLRTMGVTNIYFLFGLILVATLVEDAGKRIYRHQKNKRLANC